MFFYRNVPVSLSPAMDCKLWADVWECPMDESAMLQRLLVSRLSILSQGGGRSLADDLEDFGRVWYVSLRNAVISSSSMQASSLSAIGHSSP